jgi:monoamine oxidase
VIYQLKSVFGSKAVSFLDHKECIWSDEENTFEESDIPLYPYQNNGSPIFNKSFYDDKLLISSSEPASKFPG